MLELGVVIGIIVVLVLVTWIAVALCTGCKQRPDIGGGVSTNDDGEAGGDGGGGDGGGGGGGGGCGGGGD